MDSVHRDGRIWNIAVMLILMAFPVLVGVIFSAVPDWAGVGKGLLATAPMYWAVGFIETITYIPMLGAGGSYLSFVTGNISNLKLPCALNALEKLSGKSNCIRILENECEKPITFSEYPHSNEWMLNTREKINSAIKEYIK